MPVKHGTILLAVAVLTSATTSSVLGQITIPTVPIGNPGNAADSFGYGAVAYRYNIGSTEVTNAQYAAFLNAVAAADTNNLYNSRMDGSSGGIRRLNSAGSYTYETISGRENNPVTNVSFWDALRFANWLHNGQPTGAQNSSTTEGGAYTLTAGGISANTITRNAGWQWAVTSENEWYKAAYHQPAAQGGTVRNYWQYPTSSSTITTAQANYNNAVGRSTPVGSYAPNFYGTFDMAGNVYEWNESVLFTINRGLRGGSFSDFASSLRADDRFYTAPAFEVNTVGFRVSAIPGPSAVALGVIGGVVVARRRRDTGI